MVAPVGKEALAALSPGPWLLLGHGTALPCTLYLCGPGLCYTKHRAWWRMSGPLGFPSRLLRATCPGLALSLPHCSHKVQLRDVMRSGKLSFAAAFALGRYSWGQLLVASCGEQRKEGH